MTQQEFEKIPSSTLSEVLLWVLKRRWRLRVVNQSMRPTLEAGDELLINRHAYTKESPQMGDVVIAQDPSDPTRKLVKRVQRVANNGDCFLVGDNQAMSTDSRVFGLVSAENILGKVTSKFG